MRALVEAGLPVAAVISNRADATGLDFARAKGIAARVVEHRAFGERAAFEAALRREIDRFAPRLVALAGFMRVLTPGFVTHYRDHLLNIHPSLLPAFPGLETHARALAAGVKVHGCTVHIVTDELDSGPIVIQAALPVRPGDELRVESEVLDVRQSKSRPRQGLVKVRTMTLNQNGETVQVFVANLIVPRRQ